MSRHGSYRMVVSADTAQEAIEIAAEALPPGAELLDSSASRTDENWTVTMKFRGRKKRIPDPPG